MLEKSKIRGNRDLIQAEKALQDFGYFGDFVTLLGGQNVAAFLPDDLWRMSL